MKPVYTLAEALAQDLSRIAKTQSLTLDSARPYMGQKGSHGLFASEACWERIKATSSSRSRQPMAVFMSRVSCWKGIAFCRHVTHLHRIDLGQIAHWNSFDPHPRQVYSRRRDLNRFHRPPHGQAFSFKP